MRSKTGEPRANANVWVKYTLVILADGKWHELSEVVNALVPLVPPGRALRRSTKTKSLDERINKRSKQELIYYGAREEIRLGLKGLRANGRIQYENESARRGDPQRIRLSKKW